jgi:hypothetical protein
MLPFPMVADNLTQSSLPLLRAASARRLPRPGRGAGVHPERRAAFSSPASPFNSKLSTFNMFSLSPFPATLTGIPHSCRKTSRVSPFFATLTRSLHLTENTATLSPFPAALTDRVKHKSFVCHSYRKHRGWGTSARSRLRYIVTSLRLFFIAPTEGSDLVGREPLSRSQEPDRFPLLTTHYSLLTSSSSRHAAQERIMARRSHEK